MDRAKLDQYLAKEAEQTGVDILLNRKVLKVNRVKESWEIITNEEKYNSKLLVCSEGISGRISRQVGLPLPRPLTPAIQCEIDNISIENPKVVHLFFNKEYAKDFFAWVIPLSKKKARFGLATSNGSPKKRLTKFIESQGYSYDESENWHAHSVITCGPVSKTYSNGVISVGDSAGQVKQTTGGGVNLGGLCAKIAGNVLNKAISERKYSDSFLKLYDQKWRKLLHKEFRSMGFARWLMNKFSDKGISNLLLAFNKYEEEITKKGDMDFQSGIINALRVKPSLIFAGIKEMVKDIFR